MTNILVTLIRDQLDTAQAIGGQNRDWLKYGGLRTLCADVAATLGSFGIRQGDRIAIVLPNGTEMATGKIQRIDMAKQLGLKKE
jgi:non-ribosomal peptide synthetase component E (peptide arylation enzyme)